MVFLRWFLPWMSHVGMARMMNQSSHWYWSRYPLAMRASRMMVRNIRGISLGLMADWLNLFFIECFSDELLWFSGKMKYYLIVRVKYLH